MEEVVAQYAGDTPKQARVDTFFAEYLIYVRAGTAQLHGEPSDRSPLVVELALDKSSDVDHGFALLIPDSLWWLIVGKRKPIYKEGVGILPLPVPYFKAFALPTPRERATQKAHADMYNKPDALLAKDISVFVWTHHTRTSLLLLVISRSQKLRSFEIRKTNANKRLLINKPFPRLPP